MLDKVMGLIKGLVSSVVSLFSSDAVNVGGQIFQVGILATVSSFIGSVIKTIQRNLSDRFMAAIM